MENLAFLTLHDENYVKDKYLYHYTSFESAARILYYDSLRFSSLCGGLNDSVEKKNKIDFQEYSKLNEVVYHYFRNTINKHIRICCLAEDIRLDQRYGKDDDRYYIDYSGRGCCLPKMWSYYGKDNKGVCFIINKEKMDIAVHQKSVYMKSSPIHYRSDFEQFEFTKEMVEEFVLQIMEHNGQNDEWIVDFFQCYPECVNKNYFAKDYNWQEEHEYRYLVYSSHAEEMFKIDGFSSILEGIIIGEMFDEVDLKMFKAVVPKNIPIKQVVFQNDKTILR